MSLHHGAKIVTNGLAFAYDMGNGKKSWKGAPTFNASLQNGQNDVSPWGGDGTPTSLGIDSSVKFRGRKVAKFQTGSSGNCYINGAGDLSTGTTSTVWTTTIYLKRVDNTPLTSVTMYQYITNNTNVNAAQTLTLVEDGWYKAVYTRSGLSAGYPSLTGMTGLGVGNQYYFADWQCENNLYSTPWVSGTRSNTQALLDWTGNATITASSPTYNSDGSFTFNGGTERLDISNSIPISNNFSWSAWIRSNNISQTQNIVSMNGPYFMRISNSRVRFNILTSDGWLFQNGTTALSSDTWYNLCMVWNGATNTWTGYINGDQEFSVSKSGTVTYSSLYGYVGYTPQGGEQSYFNGDIPVLYCHAKALSAAEVQQNFQALRGRYGI